jgi:hypothetical protein
MNRELRKLTLLIFESNQIESNLVNPELVLSGQNFLTPEIFIIPIHVSVRKVQCNPEKVNPE